MAASVYFRSARTGHSDIWRIPVDGGEAQPVTNWKGEIGVYAVSPDKSLAGVRRLAGAFGRGAEKEAKARLLGRRQNPKNHVLWLIPTTSQPPGFAAPKRISDPRRHVAELDWTPDSRSIVVKELHPSPSPDVWTKSDLSEVNIETGVEDRSRRDSRLRK